MGPISLVLSLGEIMFWIDHYSDRLGDILAQVWAAKERASTAMSGRSGPPKPGAKLSAAASTSRSSAGSDVASCDV